MTATRGDVPRMWCSGAPRPTSPVGPDGLAAYSGIAGPGPEPGWSEPGEWALGCDLIAQSMTIHETDVELVITLVR